MAIIQLTDEELGTVIAALRKRVEWCNKYLESTTDWLNTQHNAYVIGLIKGEKLRSEKLLEELKKEQKDAFRLTDEDNS